MSDDLIKFPKGKLHVLDFDKKKERTEANETVADMFQELSKRALDGDVEDFVITFRSASRGVESMIGGTVKGFDFIGYLGMLELLKQRLISIMGQRSYAYSYEKDPAKKDEVKTDEKPTDPEKTDV